MIFKTKEAVENWVKQNYTEEQLGRLQISRYESTDVSWAYVAYKGNLSEKINSALREEPSKIMTDEWLKEFQEFISTYFIPEDITVYRFVSNKEYCWLDRATRWGKTCVYNGFLSTTLLKNRYRELYSRVHRRMVVKIIVPKGTKGTYLPEVNPDMPEFEVLFPHGTRLKRIGIDKYTIVSD